MRRLALLASLYGLSLLISCEDDSAYKQRPSTFQNDTLDGAAGAVGHMDAAIDAPGTGGMPATGGMVGTGGKPGTGGVTGTGGITGTGGKPATGGTPGTGGTPATGGAGGKPATGGTTGTGGTTASGGAGGKPATGGTTGTGGTPASGGAGGKSATGGTTGTGGTPATGGATGAGGTNVDAATHGWRRTERDDGPSVTTTESWLADGFLTVRRRAVNLPAPVTVAYSAGRPLVGQGEIAMADVRFVGKSATKSGSKKVAGALALVGALAGAGALLVWGCTDSSGSGQFVEPNRPFADAGADAASTRGDGAMDAAADHVAHADGANSDRRADRWTAESIFEHARRDGDTATMPSGMLDLGRGPFIVGVADRSEALGACAALAPSVRPFDLVEARVDLFSGQRLDGADLEACARLEASGTPVLVTIRSGRQGGRYSAPEAERLAIFRAALAVASWADVEDDAGIIDEVAALVRARSAGQLVVSHHDFAATPPLDLLLAVVDRCHAAAPGAVAKLATAGKSADDRAALRILLDRRPERTAVIGMGAVDDGLRVELAAAGSLLAYGFIAGPTAPGQVSAEVLHARLLTASARYAARKRSSGSAAGW
jgi:3-dehydroquinate dehydratase type I